MYLHHLTRRSLQAATLALVTALAACGGGGSDSGTPVTPAGQGTDPATNPPPHAASAVTRASVAACSDLRVRWCRYMIEISWGLC